MNYDYEIQNLKNQIKDLQDSVRKIAQGNTAEVSKREQTTAQVDSLTPYTETKTAYIGDTSCTFTDIPDGLVSIYLNGIRYYDFGVSNHSITVEFLPLEEVTEVTISIQ